MLYLGKSFQEANFLINFNYCDNLLLKQILKARVTKILIHAVR